MRLALCGIALTTTTVHAFYLPALPRVCQNPLIMAAASSSDDAGPQVQAFAVGTFVEFEEKKRTHIGKIEAVEYKSGGGARYRIVDAEGKAFDIADKVRYR